MEENFKLKLCDKSETLVAVFLLSLSEADGVIKKCDSKKDTVYSCCTWGFKVILTLLIKVIAIYTRFFQIYF